MRTFAVVGGGASGVIAAVQLLRRDATLRVDLFEPRAEIGAGIAYGTEHPGHLLNVPARGMSAFAEDPDHFINWLDGQTKWMPEGGWTPQSFVPRRLYRDYLASLLAPYLAGGAERLFVHHKQVVDLIECKDGVEAVTSDGGRYLADCAILATGNENPGGMTAHWYRDYWSSPAGFDIPKDASVVIMGTGLSMVDSVVSLLDAGHSGPITAISRRGLLPRPHDLCPPVVMDAPEIPFGASIASLCRWLRRLARASGNDCEGNWREVVDGLRPHTQGLWRSMSLTEQRRFLRHARPWWDVHRHRMAPEIHRRLEAVRTTGQLNVHAGRIAPMEESSRGVKVRFTARGTGLEHVIDADYLIDCRGRNANSGSTENPLLAALLERGTLRPDALGLALDVTGECAVIDAGGQVSERIFATGPATLGAFWEIVAVPDIRVQLQDLAGRLTTGHLTGQQASS